MTGIVDAGKLAVGSEIGRRAYRLTRLSLVKYAGASGDFNEIHWNERLAKGAGLPDVIGHGMLTMAQAGRLITEWTGDPGAVLEYRVRFAKPVVVPDTDDGIQIVVSGVIAERPDDGRVVVDITASVDGVDVLANAKAVVRLR